MRSPAAPSIAALCLGSISCRYQDGEHQGTYAESIFNLNPAIREKSPYAAYQIAAGSRYETGREIPPTIMAMLRLIYDPEEEARAFLARLREPCRRLRNVEHETVNAVSDGPGARTLRTALGLSQAAFWDLLGITQSSGSRYEAGEEMPAGAATLMRLLFLREGAAITLLTELRA